MRARSVALAVGFVFAAAGTPTTPILAAWSAAGAGSGGAAATTMPAGSTPVAAVAGSSVTVRWAGAQLGNGTPVAGYVVHRFDAGGTSVAVGGSCAGTVTTTTCTESVPTGSWSYTDTPVLASWSGPGSPASNTVTVP